MGIIANKHGVRHFAVVCYIPGRLSEFLEDLRAELKPGCALRSHVTILPPRPVNVDIADCLHQISAEARDSSPFQVELGDVTIFAKSNVVYLAIRRGERELHALHENLNSGQLEYDGPFPFHPHITLAQDITTEQAKPMAEIARERWAAYQGPRWFSVDELSFVYSDEPGEWRDLGHIELSEPVRAA